MARGDSPTPSDRPTNLALLGVLGVTAFAALLLVVVTTRAVESWSASFAAGGLSGDPYPGASAAAEQLSWRDTARLREAFGAPPPHDSAAAIAAMEGELRRRGLGTDSTYLPAATLPADLDVLALEGACGLLVLEAEATSRLTAAGRPAGLRSADDPSLIALGACGRGPFRVEGVGSARVRVVLVPGLVESDVERIGLPEDVLLAHAEAEWLLRGAGYVPSDELVRLDATGAAASSGELAALPQPPSGCVPWAVVVVGAGRLRSMTASAPADHAAERGLGLAISCAGDPSTHLALADDGSGGYVAWARPYTLVAVPSLPAPRLRSLERASVVAASEITLPAPVPAAP